MRGSSKHRVRANCKPYPILPTTMWKHFHFQLELQSIKTFYSYRFVKIWSIFKIFGMLLLITFCNILSSLVCIEIWINFEILRKSQYFGSFFDYVKGDNSSQIDYFFLKFGIHLGIEVRQFFLSLIYIEKRKTWQILADIGNFVESIGGHLGLQKSRHLK